MSAKPVYKDNTYEYDWTVRKKNANTGVLEPATGIVDLKGFIAATPSGGTIHTDLELTLSERAGAPGNYFAIVPASAINARVFPTYDGLLVYVRTKNADIDEHDGVPAISARPAG